VLLSAFCTGRDRDWEIIFISSLNVEVVKQLLFKLRHFMISSSNNVHQGVFKEPLKNVSGLLMLVFIN